MHTRICNVGVFVSGPRDMSSMIRNDPGNTWVSMTVGAYGTNKDTKQGNRVICFFSQVAEVIKVIHMQSNMR